MLWSENIYTLRLQPCDFVSSSTVEAELDTAVLDTPETDARRRDKNVICPLPLDFF